MTVRVVTDSTSDIPPSIAERLGITVIPLHVRFGDVIFRDGGDLSAEEFYERLTANAEFPGTSQPPLGDFEETYRRLTSQGFAVVSVHLSSALSGTYNSALLASESLPEAQVVVVDSQQVSMAMGWQVIRAAELAIAGQGASEIAQNVEAIRHHTHALGMLPGLDFIHKGGRMGAASRLLGAQLNVKTLVQMKFGRVQPVSKARTRSKAFQRIVEGVASSGPVERLAVVHAGDKEAAQELLEVLSPVANSTEVLVAEIGAAVGAHVGPGTVGACWLTTAG